MTRMTANNTSVKSPSALPRVCFCRASHILLCLGMPAQKGGGGRDWYQSVGEEKCVSSESWVFSREGTSILKEEKNPSGRRRRIAAAELGMVRKKSFVSPLPRDLEFPSSSVSGTDLKITSLSFPSLNDQFFRSLVSFLPSRR